MTVCLSKLSAWFYFTGKPKDDETGLYYYGARYYDPSLGRFITPDTIVQSPGGNPQTFNRYSYCGDNPVMRLDPSGHWFTEFCMFIASMGTLYNDVQFATGQISASQWGVNLATTAASMGTLDMSGASLNALGQGGFLMKASAAASIVSQAAAYAGADDVSKNLNYASQAMSGIFMVWNMGVGLKYSINEPGAKGLFPGSVSGQPSDVTSKYNSKLIINGIMNTEPTVQSIVDQTNIPAFYNPTHGAVADLTESFLGKLKIPTSVSRQYGSFLNQIGGPVNIFSHSQGTIITSNALFQLGLTGKKLPYGSTVTYMGAAISQPNAIISSLIGGAQLRKYSVNLLDPISLVGPNMNPVYIAGGTIGGITQGAKYHSIYGYGVTTF